MASAKLANSTVNHSQNATWPVKSGWPFREMSSCRNTTVVSRLPTSTMNITGLWNWIRGSSFQNESTIA